MTPYERVVNRIQVDGNACWVFQGAKANGYGKVYSHTENGQTRLLTAHRVVYEALVGPIPEGLQLDHLCRNRGCVNPAHLEPVTQRENLLRGLTIPAAEAAQTQCKRGHAFDEANTYRRKDNNGRHCRTCDRDAHNRRYRAKVQEAIA